REDVADAQAEPELLGDVQFPPTPTADETPMLFDSADDTFVRTLLTETEEGVLFDGTDDWYVRHLLEGTGEPLPVDTTAPPAEPAHAESDRQTMDVADDTLMHHTVLPEDS